jgi:splicing suppressor protein 51
VVAEQVACGDHAPGPQFPMNVRLAARRSLRLAHPRHTRSFFGLFKRKAHVTEPNPLLSEDNLFHPFSKSPFPAIRARGEAIKQLAPCPVCSSSHEHAHAQTKPQPKAVSFECPDCGWPTHCSEEHWAADQEHQKYCSRLREVNEDEHDLRSGRKLHEFDLPGTLSQPHYTSFWACRLTGTIGPQDFETAISFANWDVFWYTRGYPSMNTERSRRHSSKLLTYPMTIGSVVHQFSGLTVSNQRLTSEGSRSLAGKG